MANKKEYELAIKIAGMVDSSLGSSCNLTKKQLKEIARNAADAGKSGVSFGDAMRKAGPGIDAAWSGMTQTVMTAVEAMAAAGAAVAGIGVASINVGKEFEAAMSSWSATASASGEDYQKAREAALEMGRSTSKTATESANALEYMALAGWSVDESIAGLPGVLRLSEATGLDLARTSDLVTDSMSALGLEVNDLEGYLDVAAKANNKSNQTAEQMMEAYLGVGGTMKNLHIPIQESAAALGVLANRGIKGSEAGNALNAVMINLTTGTGRAGKMMGKLGISAFDSEGRFIGLQETLKEVNRALLALGDNEEAKNAALAAIGGKQHVDALNDLLSGLNTLDGNGVSEWDKLVADLYEADGALEQMAAVKLDNLEGDLAIFQSALADTGIGIYDNLKEPLREATQFATSAVYQFSDTIVDGLEEAIPTLRRNVLEAKDAVKEFAGPFLAVGGWMLDNPDVIAGGLAAIGTTITTLKIAKTVTDTASAMNMLKAAMVGNPMIAVIGAAALTGGAIIGVSTKMKIAETEMRKQNLAEHFGDISLSLDDLDEAAAQIIDNGRLGKLNASIQELDNVKKIADSLSDSQEALRKLNWKVDMGMELSELDLGEYERNLNAFIEDAIALGEQQQYAMNLNLQVMVNEDDEAGQAIIQQFNSFYSGMNAQLREYGEELGAVYAEGMKDGVLSMDEVQAIQELQNKMADITAKLSASQFEAKLETIGVKYGGGELDAESFQNLQVELQAQVDEASAKLEESLTMNIAGAKLQLEEGAISTDDYDAMVAHFREQYLEQIGEIQLKASSFQLDTLYQQYADELDAAMPVFEQSVSDSMSSAFETMELSDEWGEQYADHFYDILIAGLTNSGLEADTQAAIQELLTNMAPSMEQMQEIASQYEEQGKEIPLAIAKALTEAQTLEMLSGDADAIWTYIGSRIGESPEYQETYNKAVEAGGTLPPALREGIESKSEQLEQGADFLYNTLRDYLNLRFSEPISINPQIEVNLGKTAAFAEPPKPVKHALGGIFDQPHFGVFAEEGPEAFIPIDHSKRSADIWRETGKELGLLGNNQSFTPSPLPFISDEEWNNSGYGHYRDEEWNNSDYSAYGNEGWDAPDYSFYGSEEWNTPDYNRYDGESNLEKSLNEADSSGELNPFGLPALIRSMGTGSNGLAESQGKTDAEEGSESGEIQIIYSPTYYVSSSDESSIRQATSDDYSRFVQFMKQYEKDLRRLSF